MAFFNIRKVLDTSQRATGYLFSKQVIKQLVGRHLRKFPSGKYF